VPGSQVQAAKSDDLGAQAVSKELGDLPIVENAAVTPGTVRVVLTDDYTGPGSGLSGEDSTTDGQALSHAAADAPTQAPLPSPIITAGSDDPACVS
jgi:hypothetical protein